MGGHTDLLGGVVVGSKSKVGVKGDRLPLLESVRHTYIENISDIM